MEYKESLKFKGIDYREKELPLGEYEDCQFINCTLATTNLTGRVFSECIFQECDMSMAILGQTSFRDCKFIKCKLMGLHFNNCNKFLLSMQFEHCLLNFSSFYQIRLKKTTFKDCKLQEVDFVESDLTQAVFLNCDLNRAVFNNSILEGSDFVTSYDFTINPLTNRIKKARFSRENVRGLLEGFEIIVE